MDNILTSTFKNGTYFEEIYALYVFDRNIRNIFLESILKVENSMRSLVAHVFSETYGNDNYLKLDNFETLTQTNATEENKKKQIKFIQILIGDINKKIATNINNDYVKHYMTKYGFIPLWVLVNILSFGNICNYYKLMKQRERIKISMYYNISEVDLTSMLNILCKTRNLCAHDERLYNYHFEAYTGINNTRYHNNLNIPIINSRYSLGKNDLFAVVIALKLLLKPEDYNKFHSKLFSRLMSLQSKLKTITLNDVLASMKFPTNWHQISKMS